MLTLDPTTRDTLPHLQQHPWVEMDEKEPLQPLCEKDSEVTVQNTSSTWDTRGKSGTRDTKSTRDTRGKSGNHGKSSTQDTSSTWDRSSTRDTNGT